MSRLESAMIDSSVLDIGKNAPTWTELTHYAYTGVGSVIKNDNQTQSTHTIFHISHFNISRRIWIFPAEFDISRRIWIFPAEFVNEFCVRYIFTAYYRGFFPIIYPLRIVSSRLPADEYLSVPPFSTSWLASWLKCLQSLSASPIPCLVASSVLQLACSWVLTCLIYKLSTCPLQGTCLLWGWLFLLVCWYQIGQRTTQTPLIQVSRDV